MGLETNSDDGNSNDLPIHNPLKPCIIQEHFKFCHAPLLDDEISLMIYSRTKSLQDYCQPTVEIPPPLSDSQRCPARQSPKVIHSVHQEETSGNDAGKEDANMETQLTNAM